MVSAQDARDGSYASFSRNYRRAAGKGPGTAKRLLVRRTCTRCSGLAAQTLFRSGINAYELFNVLLSTLSSRPADVIRRCPCRCHHAACRGPTAAAACLLVATGGPRCCQRGCCPCSLAGVRDAPISATVLTAGAAPHCRRHSYCVPCCCGMRGTAVSPCSCRVNGMLLLFSRPSTRVFLHKPLFNHPAQSYASFCPC